MLANELLVDTFSRVPEIARNTVEGLNEEDLTWRPEKDANSIAWLVWHLTRAEDSQIANLVGSGEVWIEDQWYDKFGLPLSEDATGYGHSSDEVAAVKASADLLLGYQNATHERTLQFINGLTEKDYEKVVDPSYKPPVTVKVRLVSIVGDITQHAGQAAYVRGLIKMRRS